MRADLFFGHDPNLVIDVTADYDNDPNLVTVDLGKSAHGVTLYLTTLQAQDLAGRLLVATQVAPDEVAPVANEVDGPVCDHCGERVESDGDVRDEPLGRSLEWWTHVDGRTSCARVLTNGRPYAQAEVNGSRRVIDYENATGLAR